MNLILMDSFAFVHTGNNGFRKENVFNGMPMNGASYYFGSLAKNLAEMEDVFVAFDPKPEGRMNSYRDLKLEIDYKGNRRTDARILAQIDLILRVTEAIGVKHLWHPKFEADSIIYNVAELARETGRYREIIIHGADYDLAHNVIYDEGNRVYISLKAANSNVNTITHGNFETGIYPGKRILFNTISAYKVFNGDASDNIKRFPKGAKLYDRFVAYLVEASKQNPGFLNPMFTRKRNVLNIFLKTLLQDGTITEKELSLLMKKADLIFPKSFSDYPQLAVFTAKDASGCSYTTIDRGKLQTALMLSKTTTRPFFLGKDAGFSYDPEIHQIFKEVSKDYVDGKYLARYQVPAQVSPKSVAFGIESFEEPVIE